MNVNSHGHILSNIIANNFVDVILWCLEVNINDSHLGDRWINTLCRMLEEESNLKYVT